MNREDSLPPLAELFLHIVLFVLPRVAAFATLCRNLPELGENLASDGVPFLPADFDPASRSLRIEDLDWQPPIPPPELPPPLAMLPEATLVGLLLAAGLLRRQRHQLL